ncbi:MAG: 4Fe-4S dicluster domain-containing protein [Candidatus Auribacterota bacterium]|jgi:Na+-translocating ferredoxin:NAD+ oxidoreductase RnfC subunit|nr:4Fe-4S dicluster domain-containing protein [Candidatus Auribacterota bacterium]
MDKLPEQKKISFKGGYRFNKFPIIDTNLPCKTFEPEYVSIPLCTSDGQQLKPQVRQGHFVRKGDIIAKPSTPDINLPPVFASITGRIDNTVGAPAGSKTTDTILIKKDASTVVPSAQNTLSPIRQECKIKQYLKYLPLLCGLPRIPSPAEVSHIFISAVNIQPIVVGINAWLHGNDQAASTALDFLRECCAQSHITISCHSKEIRSIEKFLSLNNCKDRCTLAVFPEKYPSDNRYFQIGILTGKPVSSIREPIDPGYLFLDMRSLILLGYALQNSAPPTDILVPVYCEDPDMRTIVKIPVGTSLEQLFSFLHIDVRGNRVIEGGLLTGKEIIDPTYILTRSTESLTILPEKITRSFLWFLRPGRNLDSYTRCFASTLIPSEKKPTTGSQGSLRACINCGYCADVCPVGLYPNVLYNYATHDLLEEAIEKNIDRCVDCGLCTYVCPSKIPVASALYNAKQTIYTDCSHLIHNRSHCL